ncbi:MAG: hypothetical protein ACOCP4_01830, partial [Candidatus Woesearchaeota archaeon]
MKKIDAHMHVNFNGMNAHDIINYLDNNNISACWILTWEENAPQKAKNYRHLSVESVLEAYQKYPNRFIPFYAPPPIFDTNSLDDTFNKYIQKGIRGCGELKVSYLWRDEMIELYLQTLQKYNLPLLFHMEGPRFFLPAKKEVDNPGEKYYLKAIKNILNFLPFNILNKYSGFFEKKFNKIFFKGYLYDFLLLEKMLLKFPNQTFVAHGPHFWNNISNKFSPRNNYNSGKIKKFGIIDRLLEEHDNLFCDISGG